MDLKNFLQTSGAVVSVVLASLSWSDIDLALRVISSVISIIIALATAWIMLHSWWKNAWKDKKITADEIDQAAEIAKKTASDVTAAVQDAESALKNKGKEEKK